MTIQEADVLIQVAKNPNRSQRELAADTGHALGMVNRALHSLQDDGFLTCVNADDGREEMRLTAKAEKLQEENRPKRAVILAAGFGMRMVPINLEQPKALLKVRGERLIERTIRQLQEAGVKEIHIIVGFMKEKFEYLMDRYGVDLIVNPEYARRNNLYSLALAEKYIDNAYIVPSDVWCENNPYSQNELYSWYMVSDRTDPASDVRVNRKNELVRAGKNTGGNAMVGISYLCGSTAEMVQKRLQTYGRDGKYEDAFWEETLYEDDRMSAAARIVPASDVVEINTYEQLRDFDEESEALQSEAIRTICQIFEVKPSEVTDIAVLKKGMTNRSFLFEIGHDPDKKYIMRIPGEGTDQLINRRQEADVYHAISGKGLCDDPVYINPDNGYKVTLFLNDVRNCDPTREEDLQRCMKLLRKFHKMNLQVNHAFDVFGQMQFYEDLRKGTPSMYEDYAGTKAHVLELKTFIDAQPHDWCLTHIDAVPDNFLFYDDDRKLQLTDWEYSGMQDPHVDIAMFCIYSFYDREQADHLINLYFDGKCPEAVRTKIYCYIAACGLLWSNWCEYKSHLGVEFGEYSLRQYRYAKDFYRYATERMK